MTALEGDGGVRLAPVTYLPGAEPTVERVQEPVRWAIPLESNTDDAATPSTVDEDERRCGGVLAPRTPRRR